MKKSKNSCSRGPMNIRDIMEITSGFAEENAKIPGRIDSKTGEEIPDEMPLWRWRMDRNRKRKANKE